MADYFANQPAAGPGRLPIGPGGRSFNPVVLAVTVGVLVVVVLVVVAVRPRSPDDRRPGCSASGLTV